MKTIVTHPDNVAWLRAQLDKQDREERRKAGGGFDGCGLLLPLSFGIEIRSNPLMERDKPAGKYRLPCGRVVPAAEVIVRDRFCTYGPEDIHWLVYAGIIEELRERLFYELNEFRMRFDLIGPMVREPRAILQNFS